MGDTAILNRDPDMNKRRVTEGNSAEPVRKTRAIIPCLVWLLLIYVSGVLENVFAERQQLLLAACATCIGIGSTPLLGRWALLRAHGDWSRVSRGDRLAIRFVEVGVLIAIVVVFTLAYLTAQRRFGG